MKEELIVTEIIFDESRIQKTLEENPDMFADYDDDGLGVAEEDLDFLSEENEEGAKDNE